MAKETSLEYYLGTDFNWPHTILNEDETAAIDITGWSLSFMIKQTRGLADGAATLTKTVGAGITISGTFNTSPALNTQVATVAITAADSDDEISSGSFVWELKRMGAGVETILGYGPIRLIRSVHRA